MSRVTRRALILGSAAVTAGVAGILLGVRPPGPEAFVAELVRRNLDRLRANPADLAKFAKTFVEVERHVVRKESFHLATLLSPLFFSKAVRAFIPRQRRFEMEALERFTLTRFLLSTDFPERTGEQLDSELRYRIYADPYVTRCANPLARFDLE